MKAKKADKKSKTPNVHSAIFAVIIILMFVFLVHPETRQYDEILSQRSLASGLVGTRDVNEDELVLGHEQCVQKLNELEETSRLGKFIVKCDQTIIGKIINWFVLYGMRLMVIYLACHIIHQLWLLGKYFFKKYKVPQAKPNPQVQ